jgi:predicted membrane channel-forming protein YqfA (hemolysin III family)
MRDNNVATFLKIVFHIDMLLRTRQWTQIVMYVMYTSRILLCLKKHMFIHIVLDACRDDDSIWFGVVPL